MKRTLMILLALLMLLPVARALDLGEEEVIEGLSDEIFAAPTEMPWEPIPWDLTAAPNKPNPDGYLPDDGGYHDDSIDVRVETFRRNDTTVMAVYVKLTDVSQFRTELASRYPSQQARLVATMTKRVNAVMGINGDYFIYHDQGIVYRNGKRLRFAPNKGRDTLIVDEQGDLHILDHTTKEAWDAYIDAGGTVLHTFCFGPGLVINGEVLSDLDTVHVDNGKGKDTQRIAIGQIGHLEYLILATEGPENKGSVGFDLLEMAQMCKDMGMENAYNLDGGSSSTVSLNNRKINSLSTGKHREVGDCIWFATLIPMESWSE
ncbi:MAG: phosphodiester glycosidase family protein [Christensenellaceae bacterium]|nr:phosphodiester glycosidase family protein [Christensenellaceae bacterium]